MGVESDSEKWGCCPECEVRFPTRGDLVATAGTLAELTGNSHNLRIAEGHKPGMASIRVGGQNWRLGRSCKKCDNLRALLWNSLWLYPYLANRFTVELIGTVFNVKSLDTLLSCNGWLKDCGWEFGVERTVRFGFLVYDELSLLALPDSG